MTHSLFVRLAALSAALVLVACGGSSTKKCTSNTDCTTAGQVCNLSTGACETPGTGGGMGGGGGGGGTGGGSGGGTGGGSGGGGGGVGGGTGGGGTINPVDGGTIAGGETCEMAASTGTAPAITFTGTTIGLTSNYDVAVSDTGRGCNGYRSHPGADSVYQVSVPARSRVEVTVQGQGGDGTAMGMPIFDPAVYLVASPPTNCATALADGGVQATCIAESADPFDSAADLLAPETLTWRNSTTSATDVYLVVESGWDTTALQTDTDGDGTDDTWVIGQGAYTVTVVVTPLPPVPANDTCANAAALPTMGTATNGTTQGANADITFDASSDCVDTTGLGDVFYSVSIPVGQRLTVAATTQAADTAIGINVFEGACTNVVTCRSASQQTSGMAATTTYDNRGTAPITVLVEVATLDNAGNGADFSLTASVAALPPPPGNDTCAAPASLTPSTSTPGTIAGSSADMFLGTAATGCETGQGGAPMKDVFYTLAVPVGQRATIEVDPDALIDAVVNVTNAPGTCTAVASCVGGADSGGTDDPERVVFDNTTGAAVTLLIQVGSYDSEEGTFSIQATVGPIPPPPANDVCAMPQALTSGMATTGTTVSATTSTLFTGASATCEASTTPKKDVFYSLVVPPTKMATIVVTPAATMDVFINVIDSTLGCTGVGACLSGADTGFDGDAETATYTNSGAANQTVLIQVGAWAGAEDTFSITATVSP